MSMDMNMMANERVCYVHCNFCNTILAVQFSCLLFLVYFFPYSFKLSIVTRHLSANLAIWISCNRDHEMRIKEKVYFELASYMRWKQSKIQLDLFRPNQNACTYMDENQNIGKANSYPNLYKDNNFHTGRNPSLNCEFLNSLLSYLIFYEKV